MTAKPAKSTAPPLTGAPDNLHNHLVDASEPEALREAIELAFNYRGDVTIVRKSTGQSLEGYLFDRRFDRNPQVRIIPKDSDAQVAIPFDDIASLTFSGKDTASGKSFENWIRKYAQK